MHSLLLLALPQGSTHSKPFTVILTKSICRHVFHKTWVLHRCGELVTVPVLRFGLHCFSCACHQCRCRLQRTAKAAGAMLVVQLCDGLPCCCTWTFQRLHERLHERGPSQTCLAHRAPDTVPTQITCSQVFQAACSAVAASCPFSGDLLGFCLLLLECSINLDFLVTSSLESLPSYLAHYLPVFWCSPATVA